MLLTTLIWFEFRLLSGVIGNSANQIGLLSGDLRYYRESLGLAGLILAFLSEP